MAAQREARDEERGLWSACDESAEQRSGSSGTTSTASGDISISTIRYDAPGTDVEHGDSEFVELVNTSDSAADVSGWSVTDEADHRITVPNGYQIAAGGSLRIYTGPGDSDNVAYFAGEDQAIWNNSGGDTATLRDRGGEVVATYSYNS